MGGSKKSNSPRKLVRRRSHTRKASQDCLINMAEARREIVNALRLHRSANRCNNINGVNKPTHITIASSQQYYYYPLMDSLPLTPQPTRSTTGPSDLATPPPMEYSLEFEWPENVSSSYTWWLGFLKSLDGKRSNEVSKYPCEENNVVMAHSSVLGQCPEGSELGETLSLDKSDQGTFPDDWLTVPPAADQGDLV